MRRSRVVSWLVAFLAAAATAASAAPAPDCANVVRQYGHITALGRPGAKYGLRFARACWLRGVAAERAAAADGAIRPGEPVPNDYYILDEGHRTLTYNVAPTARVTMIGGGAVRPVAITVAELTRIVKGRNPRHRRLLEPTAGFWIRVGGGYPGAVLSLDQQYQP
jgi:hypothetical protein